MNDRATEGDCVIGDGVEGARVTGDRVDGARERTKGASLGTGEGATEGASEVPEVWTAESMQALFLFDHSS